MISGDISVWIKAITAIMIYSFFVRENKLFRFVEYTAIAATSAVWTVNSLRLIMSSGVNSILGGNIAMIIPLLIGALWLARYTKDNRWLTRYPIAIMLGVGFGIALPTTAKALIIDQIVDTIAISFTTPWDTLRQIIILVSVITTLYYFVFTREPKTGIEKGIRKYARWAIYIGAGGIFGASLAEEVEVFLGALMFLVRNWLGLA